MRWFGGECECLSANREVIAHRSYICVMCVFDALQINVILDLFELHDRLLYIFLFSISTIRFDLHVASSYMFPSHTQEVYFMILSLHNRTEELRFSVRLFDMIRLPCHLSLVPLVPSNGKTMAWQEQNFTIRKKKKNRTVEFDIRVCSFSPVNPVGIGNGIT